MLCGATQDGQVIVERSDRMWSTGEGNGKPLQYSCLENPMDSMKTEKDRTCCAVQPKKFKKTLMAGGLLLLGIAGITL